MMKYLGLASVVVLGFSTLYWAVGQETTQKSPSFNQLTSICVACHVLLREGVE